MQLKRKNPPTPFLLILPLLAISLSLFVYPLIYGLYISFYKVGGYYDYGFCGLDNYIWLVNDASFWNSLRVTALFIIFSLIVEFIFGLLLAVVLDKITVGIGIFRTILVLPLATTPVVVGLMFRWMFDTSTGIVNNMFLKPLGLPRINWLGDPLLALITVGIVDIWEWTPFVALILLGGIKGIPSELYEAASVDGASGFSRFRYITWPLLTPSILVAVLFNFMRLIKTYDIVVMLTQGGPGEATWVISYYIYQTTARYMHISLGAAANQLLLVIVMIILNLYIMLYMSKQFR